jgi:hypothetical protein
MLTRPKLVLSLGLFLGAIAALPTQAAPTTYTFTGVGTGFIDGNDFTNLTFSLSLIEDSTGVTMPKAGIFITPSGKATVTLAGFGTGTSTDTVHVFNNQGTTSAGLSDDTHPGDLFDVTASTFATFDLQPNVGPISTDFNPTASLLDTSIGSITFSDVTGGKFTASSAAAVPEASTLLSTGLLVTLGLGAVIAASRRKKNRTALA